MKSVLVTGSTGNVGAAVIGELLARGVSVRAAVRPGRPADMPESVQAVGFDFEEPATFDAALEGVDAVFFVRPPQMSDAKAMAPFVDAMRDARVGHVVFLSVQGAGRNPFVPHHGIERLLKKSGLAWTFLRPSFFMQNLSTAHVDDIRVRSEIYVPAGSGRTNFVDVADIAEAAAVCLTTPDHEGRAYEITGSESLTYEEVAGILSAATGRAITYPKPSARQFRARLLEKGHSKGYVTVTSAIYAIARLGMAAGMTDEFENLVGRKPTTFEEWARRNAECFAAPSA